MRANRIIKFRAWHTGLSHMFYPDESGSFEGVIDGERECSDFDYSDLLNTEVNHPYIPLQFTGLYDGMKKEVYEGDLLVNINDDMLLRWEVLFKDGCFGIRNVDTDGNTNHAEFYRVTSIYYFSDRQIIGNIYETNLLTPQTR